jgi:hypothetical protein
MNETHRWNIITIQSHNPMSNVKATDDVPVELFKNVDIPLIPIFF